MAFLPLHEVLPALAARETRTMVVAKAGMPLPVDSYTFNEAYCTEVGCDCRRVMLTVISAADRQVEAVINFGWEKAAFYGRWMGTTDRKLIAELQGPLLNPGSEGTDRAPAVLELFRQMMLRDKVYVERLASHYRMFRSEVAGVVGQEARVGKVGRNDLCPCGSGKKFKKCCGQAGSMATA